MERESKRAQNNAKSNTKHAKSNKTRLFFCFFSPVRFLMRVLVNCVCCYKKNIMLWRAAAAAARAVTRIHQVTIDGQGQAV